MGKLESFNPIIEDGDGLLMVVSFEICGIQFYCKEIIFNVDSWHNVPAPSTPFFLYLYLK